MRGEIALPPEQANRLALREEPTQLTEAKIRLGLSDYVALPGSLFDWIKTGLSDATNYILTVTQADELIGTVNASAKILVDTHAKIKTLSGKAAENAKSHWAKYAYRQQQIVKAINDSVNITGKISDRVGRDIRGALATAPINDKGMGIAIETSLIIAATVVAAVGVIGFLVVVGWVITSAVKQWNELKMYQEDVDLTIATGEATGKVAERSRKADPIIGGLDEFFEVFNWKAILAVAGVGAAGLLLYYYLKTRVTTRPEPAYALPAGRPVRQLPAGGRRPYPTVSEEFPEELLSD
jgi:hypothetical protein